MVVFPAGATERGETIVVTNGVRGDAALLVRAGIVSSLDESSQGESVIKSSRRSWHPKTDHCPRLEVIGVSAKIRNSSVGGFSNAQPDRFFNGELLKCLTIKRVLTHHVWHDAAAVADQLPP